MAIIAIALVASLLQPQKHPRPKTGLGFGPSEVLRPFVPEDRGIVRQPPVLRVPAAQAPQQPPYLRSARLGALRHFHRHLLGVHLTRQSLLRIFVGGQAALQGNPWGGTNPGGWGQVAWRRNLPFAEC